MSLDLVPVLFTLFLASSFVVLIFSFFTFWKAYTLWRYLKSMKMEIWNQLGIRDSFKAFFYVTGNRDIEDEHILKFKISTRMGMAAVAMNMAVLFVSFALLVMKIL